MNTKDDEQSRGVKGGAYLNRLSALHMRVQSEKLSPSILIIEDEAIDAKFLQTPLTRLFGNRAHIRVLPSLTGLSEHLKRHNYDIVLLDDLLQGKRSTEEALAIIRSRHPKMPVVVLSRLITRQRNIELMQLGVLAVLSKEDADSASLGELIVSASKRRPTRRK